MSPKQRIVLILFVIVFPVDLVTKWWIEQNLSPGAAIPVIDGFFQITHARNPGAALGLFQDVPVWVFIGLTGVALVLIGSFYRGVAADDRLSATALGLILSGAVGNLWDRIFRGEVVDFLQFDLGLFVFPDFNVADSAIVIGVALLLFDLFTAEAEQSEPGSGRSDSEAKHPEVSS